MSDQNKQAKKQKGFGHKYLGQCLTAALIVCLVIGVLVIQDSIVFTADGMEYVPRERGQEDEQQTEQIVAQVTLPHATAAGSGEYQSIAFEPAVFGDLAVEEVELSPKVGTGDRVGRVLTFGTYATADFADTARLLAASGETLVVIELKSPSGKLAYKSSLSMAERANADASSTEDYYLRDAVEELHNAGLRVAAKISCMADSRLADAAEELVLKDAAGLPCRNEEGYVLLDPSNEELRHYLASVAADAISIGFDTLILEELGCPQGAETDETALLTLTEEIRKLMGEQKLALTVYPATRYGQSTALKQNVDELWSCQTGITADYRIDGSGNINKLK